eukprot:9334522-Alexandrium_andersonii.AAC.1
MRRLLVRRQRWVARVVAAASAGGSVRTAGGNALAAQSSSPSSRTRSILLRRARPRGLGGWRWSVGACSPSPSSCMRALLRRGG